MKKMFTILLTLLMIFTLVGCNSESKEEQPVVDAIQEEVVKEPVEEEPEQLAGGWTDTVDSTITDELKDIFNKGIEGILGATYKPTKLLATQVVNGINYKFLAEGEKTTNPPVKGIYNITINKSSDGTISLLDIEVVEEELPEQKQTKDVTQMSFWVVFYDQYGNELQREALKYGSTPSYKKDLPEGFEKWVYKKTQKDVGTLKAITGNTYYQAICHAVSHNSSNINPTPDNVNYLYFKNIGAAQTSITMIYYSEAPDDTLEFVYSKDKINWNPVTIDVPFAIDEGESVFIKAKTSNPYMIMLDSGIDYKGVTFTSNNTSALEVGGSIMTLLDSTDTLRDISGKDYCLAFMFAGMHNIRKADKLVAPATKLAPYCYSFMLSDTGIVSINPNLLPATDLSRRCYEYMFYDCSLLENSPILPATTLSKGCYSYMFKDCPNLSTITMLAKDVSAEDCLDHWVDGVAETGTFTRLTNIPSGDNGIPTGWDSSPLGYIVTFDMKEHGDGAVSPINVIKNSKLTKPVDPVEEGFIFENWYKDVDCTAGKEWNFDSDLVTGNMTLYAKWSSDACLAKGTMITMSDGSKEAIENITRGDLVRVFNHDTGKVSSAKVMDYWQYEEKKNGLITLHFTNDIDVNIVAAHGFYNKEDNKYVVLYEGNINSYIGKHFYNVDKDSWETLLGATYSGEKVDTFFIATEGQLNTVAEGMLNVEDGIHFVLRNTFDFDEDMKVDEIKKTDDIQRYGLFERKYLTEEAFDKYGAAILKVALGKGMITRDYLDMLIADSATYESDNFLEEYVPENVQHSVK